LEVTQQHIQMPQKNMMDLLGLLVEIWEQQDSLGGAGTQTAGLAFGGDPGTAANVTEEYDGSAWTAGGNLNTARRNLAGCGTQTAGLAFGGVSTAGTGATEEYDGSSWTNTTSMGTARYQLAGAGTQTAGLAFGGTTSTGSKQPQKNTQVLF
jgi:hypothetical protein